MAQNDGQIVAGDPGGVPAEVPTWIPPVSVTDDGSLFRVVSNIFNEVYTAPVELDGSSVPGPPTRISKTVIGGHLAPAWSPDGKFIAYFTKRPLKVAGAQPERVLTIQNMSSGETQELPVPLPTVGGYSPRWSPDSQHVAIWGSETAQTSDTGHFRVDMRTTAMTISVLSVLAGRP